MGKQRQRFHGGVVLVGNGVRFGVDLDAPAKQCIFTGAAARKGVGAGIVNPLEAQLQEREGLDVLLDD